jgi:hypothetical protein
LESRWEGHVGPVHALAFAPDGATFASAGQDNEVRIWRLSNSEQTLELPKHRATIKSLRFSPDGSFLAGTGPDNIALWSVAANEYGMGILRGDSGMGHGSAFPDASSLAFVSHVNGQPSIAIVDLRTAREKKQIELPFRPHRWSTLSATGKWFAAVNAADSQLYVVNVPSKRVVARAQPLFLVDFIMSPDERFLAGFDKSHDVGIVELTTGLIRRQLPRHEKSETCLALSSDGRLLACGGMDHSVLLWDLTGRRVNGKEPAVALSPAELQRLWEDIDSTDGATVHRAVWTLAAGSRASVPYLRDKLVVPRANAERVAKLMSDLESEVFKVRNQAEAELTKMSYDVEPHLRKKLGESISLEGRLRIQKLLSLIDNGRNGTHMIRVIEVLERCGNPEAEQLLQQLFHRDSGSRRAGEAAAALRRLNSAARDARH